MSVSPPTATGVRSVLRALDVLALFTEQRSLWTIRDLTEVSGLAKTTVIRLVGTLEQRGLLWTSPDGSISAGPGLLKWSRLAQSTWQLPGSARQVLTDLSQQCAETVNLYVRGDRSRVCVAQQEGPQSLRRVVRVGDELPLWAGAASHILLAESDDAVLTRVISTSEHNRLHVDELRERITLAQRAGFAISHGEREWGASGLAAPVLNEDGHVLAALSLGGPTPRFTTDRIQEFAPAVISAADTLSKLGLGPGAVDAQG